MTDWVPEVRRQNGFQGLGRGEWQVQNKGYTELYGHGFLGVKRQVKDSAFSLRLVKVTKVNKNKWHDELFFMVRETDRDIEAANVGEGWGSCHECVEPSKMMSRSEVEQSYQEHVEFRGNVFQLEIICIGLKMWSVKGQFCNLLKMVIWYQH